MQPRMRGSLSHLLAGTRGGPRRLDILLALDGLALNAHEVSLLLGMEYKAVRHHLKVLKENGLVVAGTGYAARYAWSLELQGDRASFAALAKLAPVGRARPSPQAPGGAASEA